MDAVKRDDRPCRDGGSKPGLAIVRELLYRQYRAVGKVDSDYLFSALVISNAYLEN